MTGDLLDRIHNPTVDLSPDQILRFDDFVLKFERTWTTESLSTHLDLAAAEPSFMRTVLMTELVSIDMERQWTAGNRLTAEDYLRRFDSLAEIEATTLMVAECQNRLAHEEPVDWQAISESYPSVTEEVKEFVLSQAKRNTATSRENETQTQSSPLDGPTPVSWNASSIDGGHEKKFPFEFGRYRIEEELGRGGMGIVFRAYDTELERTVAVKVPNPEVLPSQQASFVARLYEEARAAARLVEHPHICSVYDVGQIDGTHYITMAYVPGQSLAEHLQSSGRMPPRMAIKIARIMAETLQAAHEHGVVHRDLKPANVMLNSADEPVITDFGLATRVKNDESVVDHPIGGTPAYMSPEQANGDPSASGPLTDVYSLGVIFFEMLTGERPVVHSHRNDSTIGSASRAPGSGRPELGLGIDSVCARMVHIDPKSRFQSMREVADALGSIGSSYPNDTNPTPGRSRARGRKPYVRWGVGVAAICCVALLFFFSLVYRNQGEVQFEIYDKNVTIEVDQSRYTIADIANPRRLGHGKHDLTLRVGEITVPVGKSFQFSDQGRFQAVVKLDGVTLSTDHFEVHRGEKHVMTVRLVREQPATPPRLSPLDRLARETLSESIERVVGLGRASDVPKELVAAFGDSRLMHWHRIHRCSVSFEPDGKRVASASYDSSVIIWDSETGMAKNVFTKNGVGLTALTWPSTDRLIVGTADGIVFEIDIDSGSWNELMRHDNESSMVDSLSFSQDGRYIVSTAADSACLYSLSDRTKIREMKHKNVRSAALTADGDMVVTAGGSSVIRFWETETGKLIHTFKGESRDLYNTVTFSPDEKSVFVGLCNTSQKYKGRVRSLDVGGDQWSRLLSSPGGFAWSVRFSPDGKYLAEARESGDVHLWDVASWTLIRSLPTTEFPTLVENGKRTVAISGDSQMIASGGADNAVHTWNLPTSESIARPVFGRLHSVALHPKTLTVASGGDRGSFDQWNLTDGNSVGLVNAHECPIRSLVYTPDARLLVSAGDDGFVRFWNTETGKRARDVRKFRSHSPMPVQGLAVHGSTIASIRLDASVECWDYETGELRFSLPPTTDQNGLAIAISRDGTQLARAGLINQKGKKSGLLSLRDALRGSERLLIPLKDPIRSVSFAPSGDHVAVVSSADYLNDTVIPTLPTNGTITLINTMTGKTVLSRPMLATGVSFSNDGRKLLVSGFDGMIRIFDLPSEQVRSIRVGPSNGVIAQAVFGPQDRHVITANRNGTVYVIRVDEVP